MTGSPANARTPRLPVLLLGALSLGAGLWAGLLRLGAVGTAPVSPADHGPLMVSGFLGTVIALERAVAARATWALIAPAATGLGALLLMLGHPQPGAALLVLGSLAVLAVMLSVTSTRPETHEVLLLLAAGAWLLGNLLFAAGQPVFRAVPFWLVFLVGTIAAERLELNRLLPRTRGAGALFFAGLALFAGGAAASLWWPVAGLRALGAGTLGLAAWMLAFDIARRTIRLAGQVRYIAAALLAGYFWLGAGGLLALAFGAAYAGPLYDATLHAFFVGFVFSMIFGHALIILPAVAGVRVPFKPRFYLHLAVLHAALALRVAGDLLGHRALTVAGAWGGTAAIALFLVSTLSAAVAAALHPTPRIQPCPAPRSSPQS
jgi:hypothetical protein